MLKHGYLHSVYTSLLTHSCTVGHTCRDTDPLTQGACGHIYVVTTLEEKGDGEGGRDGEGEGGGEEGGRREEGGEDRVDGREGMIVRE